MLYREARLTHETIDENTQKMLKTAYRQSSVFSKVCQKLRDVVVKMVGFCCNSAQIPEQQIRCNHHNRFRRAIQIQFNFTFWMGLYRHVYMLG